MKRHPYYHLVPADIKRKMWISNCLLYATTLVMLGIAWLLGKL